MLGGNNYIYGDENFKDQTKYQKIIIHWGSGITACPNIIGLDVIGLKPVLYLGGWGDWAGYDENDAIIGELI